MGKQHHIYVSWNHSFESILSKWCIFLDRIHEPVSSLATQISNIPIPCIHNSKWYIRPRVLTKQMVHKGIIKKVCTIASKESLCIIKLSILQFKKQCMLTVKKQCLLFPHGNLRWLMEPSHDDGISNFDSIGSATRSQPIKAFIRVSLCQFCEGEHKTPHNLLI